MPIRTSICLLLAMLMPGVFDHAAEVRCVPTPDAGIAPDAEVDEQGIVHLAYVSGDNVYYAKSSDHGKTFGAAIRVNSDPDTAFAGMYRGPDLACGRNGRIHVIWYNNGYQRQRPKDEWGVMYSHLNPEKTAFVPAQNLNRKPSDNFSLAADSRGNVDIFWMAEGLFLTASSDDGETFADAAKVNGPDTCECCGSRAAITPDGSLFCAYRDKASNNRNMFLLTRAAGQSGYITRRISVTPWEINGCPMTGTFLAPSRSGLIMGWETKGQIFFTRIPVTGHEKNTREIQTPAERGKYPVALSAPDGSAMVSWKKGSTLEWQLYDANDAAMGEIHSVPGHGANRHAGVVTRNGDFVLID